MQTKNGDQLFSNDLLSLQTLEDSTVLSCLLQRYGYDQIYTWLGENILVALNPNKELAELYGNPQRDAISQNDNLGQIPHIYSLTEHCLRQMLENKMDQSVIISGLSGSGKTEAAKHVLRYLVQQSSCKRCCKRAISEGRIEQHLLLSNPILEAFGNARTVYNPNSSRFGKFLSLFHTREQVVVGATVQVYLLEKPRTVFDSRSVFSSFHIFPLFLSSLSIDQAEQLGLGDLVSAPRQSGEGDLSSDRESWSTVLDALSGIGFSSSDILQLQNILASILLLNTSRFIPTGPAHNPIPLSKRVHELSVPDVATENSTSATIHPEDVEKVVLAGRLLGLEDELADEFPQQLLTRRVQAGSGSNAFRTRRLTVYATTCTVAQAKEHRDCLVKTLYSNLFEHIVETINKQLRPPEDNTPLNEFGILDLFGFERFTDNGFEQYCINYANERLHQNFMRIAVNSVHNELVSEGLISAQKTRDSLNTVTCLRECDNTPVVEAMKQVAGLLDEVCLLNRVHETSAQCALDPLDSRDLDWMRRLQLAFPSGGIISLGAACKSVASPRLTKKLQTEKATSSPGSFKRGSPSQHHYPSECFTVRHFAGGVTYSIHGFVAKNLDRIPMHLLNWLADSVTHGKSISVDSSSIDSQFELPLLHTILVNASRTEKTDRSACASPVGTRSPLRLLNVLASCSPPVASPLVRDQSKEQLTSSPVIRDRTFSGSGGRTSRRINTVFGNFKCAVDSLLLRLQSHQLSFVRCLRPNLIESSQNMSSVEPVVGSTTRSCYVDRDRLHEQLVTGGLLAAVYVLRSAYSTRYTYTEFTQKYSILWRLCPTENRTTLNPRIPEGLPLWFMNLVTTLVQSSRGSLQVLRDDSDRRQALFLLILGLGTVSNAAISHLHNFKQLDSDVRREIFSLLRQFGRTRLHLKPDQAARLRNWFRLIHASAARIIQRNYQRYRTRTNAATVIQTWWRGVQRAKQYIEISPCRTSPLCSVVANFSSKVQPMDSVTAGTISTTLSEFATNQPYFISRQSLYDIPPLIPSSNYHFWNQRRMTQLHCLLPFVWRRPSPDLYRQKTRGLADALS